MITSACFSRRAASLLSTGSESGKVHLWSVDDPSAASRSVYGSNSGAGGVESPLAELDPGLSSAVPGTGSRVECTSFDSQDRLVGGGLNGGSVHLWDVNSGARM